MTNATNVMNLLNAVDTAHANAYRELYPYVTRWLEIQLERDLLTGDEVEKDYEYSSHDEEYVTYISCREVDDNGVQVRSVTIRVPVDFMENPEPYFERLERFKAQQAEWANRRRRAAEARNREDMAKRKAELEKELAGINQLLDG